MRGQTADQIIAEAAERGETLRVPELVDVAPGWVNDADAFALCNLKGDVDPIKA